MTMHKIPKVISIIGGQGKLGSLFASKFKENGFEVLITSKDKSNNQEIAKKGDVVIVTVPIRKTEYVIQEIAPFVSEDSLLTDFTSVKEKPVKIMSELFSGEVIGGHPLFGPIDSLQGNKFILCPVRNGAYFSWYKSFLQSLGLHVYEMTPDNHDRMMSIVQCLTHISNVCFINSLQHLQQNFALDLSLFKHLSTPSYQARIQAASTMLQDAGLYADIQKENKYSQIVAETYNASVQQLLQTIKGKDFESIEIMFKQIQQFIKEGGNDS